MATGRRRTDPARGDRRLSPGRRHPHGAAFLQHARGNRARDGRAEPDRSSEVARVMKRIAVLGAGTMGHGIALRGDCAEGYETRIFDVSEASLQKGVRDRGSDQQGCRARQARRRLPRAMRERLSATTEPRRRAGRRRLRYRSGARTDRSQAFADGRDRSAAPRIRDNCDQHVGVEHHRDGGRDTDPVARGRHALLQSRPQDEADRDRPAPREFTRRHCRRSRTSRGDGKGDGSRPRVPWLHHHPCEREYRQRSVLHADGRCRLGARHRQGA